MTKRFYLFSDRGMTERFFCGNIYESLPDDEIKVHGQIISFEVAERMEFCKGFDTRKEADRYAYSEVRAMEESNNYAERAMACEEKYGCDGVDDCSGDY